MTLLALIRQNLRHIVRTRLLLLLLAFSFLIQYLGVRVVSSATVHFQGVVSQIGQKNGLFIALFFQLFTGAFLSAVYGIWMIPYAHQGARSPLTFTLPVAKWKFPVAYGLSMLLMLLVQHAVLLASYAMNFGFDIFWKTSVPWAGLASGLVFETLAFEVFTFGFAVSAMSLGQIPTFFLGAGVFFVLQIAGAIFRLNVNHMLQEPSQALTVSEWVYGKLPPVGDLVFDLRRVYSAPTWNDPHLILWAVWLFILILAFRIKLRYPLTTKNTDV